MTDVEKTEDEPEVATEVCAKEGCRESDSLFSCEDGWYRYKGW
eukprot:CAMPEP_0181110370 /NCGR_PEP_ID=MMETSP1071-20121207/18683_1 /TAXON_ID=35127 /ORGANISM="Thalassiosira sp., Strain NH16" /LENGTH=42 /DNA_ID= /DNA_START= /DNA_END= /DNA_ORIENTATION=